MKLDSFNKILIATAQINYMAASLEGVRKDYIFLKMPNEELDKALSDALSGLSRVMEDLGDYINETDSICEIDVRVSKAPFDIIIHGKDEVDELYEEE